MNFNTCAKRETFPKASWTALSSKHTSSPKNLPEAILILYSMCSDRDWYSAAPPWRQSGTQGWAIKPECPMSPQKASPVPSKGAVSQLSGSARTRNLSSQPRYCFSNNFCKRGFCPGLAKLAAWLSGLSWSLFSQESMALCRSTALEWRQPMLFPSPGQLQGTFGTGTLSTGVLSLQCPADFASVRPGFILFHYKSTANPARNLDPGINHLLLTQ